MWKNSLFEEALQKKAKQTRNSKSSRFKAAHKSGWKSDLEIYLSQVYLRAKNSSELPRYSCIILKPLKQ